MIRHDWQYTTEHAAQYAREGYCVYDRFLTEQALFDCRGQIDRMLTELEPGRDPSDIISPHQIERWVWDLATEPQILDMIEAQIGPNIVLWSSHMLLKSPGSGIEVPWHQDAPYWNVSGPLPAGLWIAFDDMDAENGAMAVLPGWHTKGVLPRDDRPGNLFHEMISPDALPENVEEAQVQYSMPAGGMAIHDTMIPHCSQPNRSDRWRRVLVLRYMSADGEMGDKIYADYRDGSPMPRVYFLVRGEDVAGRGLPTAPTFA